MFIKLILLEICLIPFYGFFTLIVRRIYIRRACMFSKLLIFNCHFFLNTNMIT